MIWVIGCGGMLGRELSALLERLGLDFVGTDRETDIVAPSALGAFAEGKPIEWIVNCAAYTAVDRAEDDADACRRLNALGAANAASCSRAIGAGLVHVSTDYVFSGNGSVPCREGDSADPVGVYGRTKREGELLAIRNCPRSYVIRTSWLYGAHGRNFVATMLALMNERDEIRVVDDQRGGPTWAFDLANAIVNFIGSEAPYGIYHYANEGEVTWFGFAREIYERGREIGLVKRECRVLPCSSLEYPTRAPRPAYSVLDKAKIKSALGIAIPEWGESLKGYLKSCAH